MKQIHCSDLHGEKPFIIMDTPFVNLDYEQIVKALELLNKLGESSRILIRSAAAAV